MENNKDEIKQGNKSLVIRVVSMVFIVGILSMSIFGFNHMQKRIDGLSQIAMEYNLKSQQMAVLAAVLATNAEVLRNALLVHTPPEPEEIIRYIQVAAAPAPVQVPAVVSLEDTAVPLDATPAELAEAKAAEIIPGAAQEGQTVMITISAPNLNDVYGYELKIHYNPDVVQYAGGLKSNITEIPTIFAKQFDKYVQIGATKIGKVDGFSASNTKTEVCTMSFTALKDFDMAGLRIDGVSIVNSDMQYHENIRNWEISTLVNHQ